MRYPYAEVPAEIAARVAAGGVRPLNLYRVLANAPALLEAWIGFAYTLRSACRTPRSLRELIILRTALLQQSAYEWEQHRKMAREAGVPEEQVAELGMWTTSRVFDAKERAALALTDAIVGGTVDDATHAELMRHFDREEALELTVTAAFYCMVPRILSAIAVTSEGEPA